MQMTAVILALAVIPIAIFGTLAWRGIRNVKKKPGNQDVEP